MSPPDLSGIPIGSEGIAEMVVGSNDTARRVGSGTSAVLATPVLVSLMEEAALAAVEACLPEGFQSLGTRLEISHVAATPTGMAVRATARLLGVSGRRLTLSVRAEDAFDMIGEGTHERVVVESAPFLARIAEKSRRRE
ncbi:MAG: thioesterase family protein [Pseudomonadota bacterium]